MKRYIIQKKEFVVHLSLPNFKGLPKEYIFTPAFMFKNQALAFIKNEKLEGFKVVRIDI